MAAQREILESMEDRAWKLIKSWIWALAPLWTLGFGTAAVHLHAAVRKRSIMQAATLPVYLVGILFVTVWDPDFGRLDERIFSIGMGINMLVGVAHSVAIRGWVWEEGPRPPSLRQRQRFALASHRETLEARENARELALEQPQAALELKIGRPDLSRRTFPDGGLVDVNNVRESALVEHLGVPKEEAELVAGVRDQVGGFSSYADMLVTAHADHRCWDPVADRLVFLPRRS